MTDDLTPTGRLSGKPSVARMYDHYLGGKDAGPADREAAEEVIARAPIVLKMAKANRRFLERAVAYLAGECGIRQFVDIGSGLPTSANTHEIAQKVAADSRVVYVDKDPLVLSHARALLAVNGNIAVITADLREPEKIISHPELTRLIDWSQPVAVMLLAILPFVPDRDDPYGIVARFQRAMASGSYLAISHGESTPELQNAAGFYDKAVSPTVTRTREQVAGFFSGFELVDPGLVPVPAWRPSIDDDMAIVPLLGGVARKVAVEATHG